MVGVQHLGVEQARGPTERRPPPGVREVRSCPVVSGFHQTGDPSEVGLLESQVQVPPGGPGDAREPLRQRHAGGPTQHLVEEVAVGEGVLGDSRARCVDGRSAGQQLHERVPVVVLEARRLLREGRQSGLVREQL
ncbi:hypothetical protein ASG70_14800 [Phycicoccus sp. Soil748]|nr:hypothetical protein ASG70_14800 [Phycicoccus sp. Soil748]